MTTHGVRQWAAIAALALGIHGAQAAPGAVDEARIIGADSEPGSWLAHGRTYGEQRFSPLDAINADNVGTLGLAWYADLGTRRGLEATPIVVDGVVYTTGDWSRVYAIDAKTGKQLWAYDPKVPREWGAKACCDVVNRGAAVWKGRVYVGTIDGRLIAIDAATGQLVWETLTIDRSKPYSITGAPRIVKDKVVIGNGGAEFGVRGYVSAYDAATGQMAWRFWTVPGNPAKGFETPDMELAAKTWNPAGEWWNKGGGGGTVWDSMAYDPELNLLYVGVGNGAPWNRWERSLGEGDNLFLSSIVALNPDTGRHVWHYQTTPSETWDYTATQHMILADITLGGQLRKVIMQAPKNGFFYVLDRATGQFISAENYVHVTWATHVDPATGRPVESDPKQYRDQKKLTFPAPFGGHNWQPMSYSPLTGLVYIPAMDLPYTYAQEKGFEYGRHPWNMAVDMTAAMPPAGQDPILTRKVMRAIAKGHIAAWDPVAQKEAWRVQHDGPWNGGMLSTAGNLLFQGNAKGELVAYRADNGQRLWSAGTQSGIVAPPVTYSVDGEQYVAVMVGWGGALGLAGGIAPHEGDKVGGRLLAFKLGGSAQLPPAPPPPALPQPPAQTASADTIDKGDALYHAYCSVCHGLNAESSTLADLRYMQPGTHELFDKIVLDGLYKDLGMVGWAQYLSADDTHAIHAYLIERAHQTQREQAGGWWLAVKSCAYGVLAKLVAWFIQLTA
jgi:PQQ-dependent dehydrogenase (methanol/ethanol family)